MALHGTACAEDTKTPPAKKDPKTMTLDELEAAGLCPVKKIESKQIYHYDLNGKTYHFCCRECQDEFEAHPEKYGAKADKPKDPAPEPKK
jgi:YHS domain-containing protein